MGPHQEPLHRSFPFQRMSFHSTPLASACFLQSGQYYYYGMDYFSDVEFWFLWTIWTIFGTGRDVYRYNACLSGTLFYVGSVFMSCNHVLLLHESIQLPTDHFCDHCLFQCVLHYIGYFLLTQRIPGTNYREIFVPIVPTVNK